MSEVTAVIGAGAWGTTIAWLLGSKGLPVRLWARSEQQAEVIAATHTNETRLPGVTLPESVAATSDLAWVVEEAQHVVVAVPSEHVRGVAGRLAAHLPEGARIISATKGLELTTGKRMSEVLGEETGLPPERLLALSGPNLSGEIAAGMPAVSVVAGVCPEAVAACQRLLATALFRTYGNCDILGVEMCGALKNVIALAAGINDGLGYGANAKAALLTRGLAEISRLGIRLGADRATFWGVAGVGDMVATSSSRLSRNWQVGYQLGSGQNHETALASQAGVAEGVRTTAAAADLAERVGVEAPIITALRAVLFEGREPEDAVRELMTRPGRSEAENLA